MKVSVVSCVGAYRTGKSALLSWFLRYLRHTSDTVGGNGKGEEKKSEAMASAKVKEAERVGEKWWLKGGKLGEGERFDWRGGSEVRRKGGEHAA